MKKVARMLRTHEELLLNWFQAKGEISSGAVEGLNNKIRVVTRRSYGFRTYRCDGNSPVSHVRTAPGTGEQPTDSADEAHFLTNESTALPERGVYAASLPDAARLGAIPHRTTSHAEAA